MPRFHFHLLEDGQMVIDDAGVERPSLEAVQRDAIRAAREVMCAELQEGRLFLTGSIEVTDEGGKLVLSLPFRDCVEIVGVETQH